MKLPNPKRLSDEELLWAIQNVMINKNGCPEGLKIWYKKIEKEFYDRDVKLEFIISAK